MKNKRILWLAAAVLLLVMVGLGTAVLAQISSNYDVSWHVIGGGGAPASSATFQINGTMGQGLAGPPLLTGPGYTVHSGYWVPLTNHVVYLPTVLR